jgi:hypothetical protein
MEHLFSHARNWQPLIAIFVVVGGVMWYFVGLESRVRLLEIQVHALAVAPTIAQSVASLRPPSPGQGPGTKPGDAAPGQQIVANPTADACAKLADTFAEQVKAGYASSLLDQTRDALKTLSCVAPNSN